MSRKTCLHKNTINKRSYIALILTDTGNTPLFQAGGRQVQRPLPPKSFLELSDLSDFGFRLTPAPEAWEWLQAEIFSNAGGIYNEDHAHLLDADIRVMWASSSFEKQRLRR